MQLLLGVLPEHVHSAECALTEEPAPLYPEEAEAVARAVPKRRREFALGRTCARRALLASGVGDVSLPMQGDRSVKWPSGIHGSISHTGTLEHGWCGAAVGSSVVWDGIGIDAEPVAPLGKELWRRIMSPEEEERLPRGDRGLFAKLLFCAKEAFYKCQYPSTHTFLGFLEVEVEFDRASNIFFARLLEQQAVASRPVARGREALNADVMQAEASRRMLPKLCEGVVGRFVVGQEWLVAALCVPREAEL